MAARCVTETCGTTCAVHIEGWWLLGGRSSVVRALELKPATVAGFDSRRLLVFTSLLFPHSIKRGYYSMAKPCN